MSRRENALPGFSPVYDLRVRVKVKSLTCIWLGLAQVLGVRFIVRD